VLVDKVLFPTVQEICNHSLLTYVCRKRWHSSDSILWKVIDCEALAGQFCEQGCLYGLWQLQLCHVLPLSYQAFFSAVFWYISVHTMLISLWMPWQNIDSIVLCENFSWVLDAKQNGMNMELQVGLGEGVSPAAATDLIARLEFSGAQLSLWSILWSTRGLTRVGVCFVIWIQSCRKLSRRFVKAVSSMWSLWKAIPQPCLLYLVYIITANSSFKTLPSCWRGKRVWVKGRGKPGCRVMPVTERSRAVGTVFGGLYVGSVVGYAHETHCAYDTKSLCHW
jgi:hypothetical protein